MWTRLLTFHATDSSDPLTSLRFGDRSKRRKRQKLLIRIAHFISFTLGAAIPPGKWTLVSCPACPGPAAPDSFADCNHLCSALLLKPRRVDQGQAIRLIHRPAKAGVGGVEHRDLHQLARLVGEDGECDLLAVRNHFVSRPSTRL